MKTMCIFSNLRKLVLIVPFFMTFLSYAQNTLPVIPFGERKADLYYWDTNWIDRYEHLHPNSATYPAQKYLSPVNVDMYIGRACVADTPILVKGIAGCVFIGYTGNIMWVVDTTMSGRLPEYFKMYDAQYNMLGESRWDTVVPTYKMEFRSRSSRQTYDVYEVYFDKPILVSGQFYVGGTTHNNLRHGAEEDGSTTGYVTSPEHLMTYYPQYYCNSSNPQYVLYQNPPYNLVRYYWPYAEIIPYTGVHYDTSSFALEYNNLSFYPFFAIIDTDYVYMDCEQPVGLGVMGADADSIVLSWDSSGAPLWDVLLWADGVEPDSGMLFSVETNRLTLYGLDTLQHYNVKVKAVCDTLHINTSPWSSVFGFRVSDYIVRPCPVPEGLRVQPMTAAGSVIARWDNSEVGLWELAVWGEDAGDTLLLQSSVEYVEVDGLDTARWYAASVRGVCDSTNISEWSDTVRFFVPNPNPGGTEGVEDAVGQHTYLMPNPTSDKVTVCSLHLLRRIELFGSDGKPVMALEVDGHSATLDLGSCPAGTYIVRVTTSAGVTNKRLVKR